MSETNEQNLDPSKMQNSIPDSIPDSTVERQSQKDDHYWRSLEEWSSDEEYQKLAQTEFMSSPTREADGENSFERRNFLKLMASSIALASASCTRRPVEHIVPYVKQPEEVIMGLRLNYSSTWTDGLESFGMLVSTQEGRPLKVEGNPLHPINNKGLSARAQAHILSLYDPERLKGPIRNLQNKERTNRDTIQVKWEDADKAIVEQLNKGDVAILTGSLVSPSTRALVGEFAQAFSAKHYVWNPISYDAVIAAQKESYGEATLPNFRLDRAKTIVSIDTDLLGTWLAPTQFARQFATQRKTIAEMSRLIVFESNYSLTGANADIRVPIKPSQQLTVAMGLLHDVVLKNGKSQFASNDSLKSLLQPYASAWTKLGMTEAQWAMVVDSLLQQAGESLIVAGGMSTQTADQRALLVAINLLNTALGNDGVTVDYSTPVVAADGGAAQLNELIEAIEAGKVKTLIIHGVNPVYASWAGDRLRAAAKQCALVLSTADRNDETAQISDYVLPDHHPMESWSDVEFIKNVLSIQQPTIRPLYDTRSFQLSLLSWAYLAEKGSKNLQSFETFYDYLRNNWKEDVVKRAANGKTLDAAWEEALENGFIGRLPEQKSSARAFKTEAFKFLKPTETATGLELSLYPTIALRDGTLANVSWLQELPDPITKIVWDNYLNISMGLAETEKLKEGDLVEVKSGATVLKLPVHIQPGLHDGVVTVAIGYGRTAAGKVANGVGINVNPLGQFKDGSLITSGLVVNLKKLGKKYDLANVQGHHTMEGRQIVAEATLKQYQKNPSAGIHKHHIFSLWPGHQYNGNKWGMAIDLNVCNGCSACIVACQSENNIPVVGKNYVLQGREMHWLRVDRYYVGDPKNAEVVFQPLVCQQCDNAPCETVCPVIATAHNTEGLNDMSYNRCVGTRYCANNCPYKVRRFNWFYFTATEKPLNLAMNPDVTVRTRGVMEKCTFCVHRIKAKKSAAKVEKRVVKDGEIQTACQQSCPTDAITFGDLNNPESAVAKAFKNDPRAYALLEEFNAAPSVRYMSKIRNNGNETRFPEGEANKGGHA